MVCPSAADDDLTIIGFCVGAYTDIFCIAWDYRMRSFMS
jgi:hypothetical protein